MFRGITVVTMDAKGRMAIPTRYRHLLQDSFNNQLVITIDPEERCLLLYPLTLWETVEKKIEALPSFNRNARRIQRLLVGHAADIELDSQARILVPPLLREYALIQKQVMLVGQGKKFEVWSAQRWQVGRETWLTETWDTQGDTMPNELSLLSL